MTRRLVVAAAICAGAFVLVALAVTLGWDRLASIDTRWSSRAYAFTLDHAGFQDVARFVTDLAGGWSVAMLTAAVAVGLAVRRQWVLGWWLVLTVAGSSLLSTLLKVGLERVRPENAGHLTSAHGFAFPSGHTQAATVTYVAIVLVVGWQVLHPRRAARAVSVVAVCLLVGAVGLSRIYLGAHWPSDVLGGWFSGSAWALAATALLLGRLQRATAGAADSSVIAAAGTARPGP